jgi:hypothetical protein
MEKLIKGLLGTIFKMPETEIAELLKKPDGSDTIDEDKLLQTIIDKDKDRVAKLKADGPKWDDAVKKATKEVWNKVEKSLKEGFEIDTDLQGDELVAHVVESAKDAKAGKGGSGKKVEDLTEDEIKKHPVFVKAEKNYQKALADKDAEKTTALQELQNSYTSKETFSKVREAALLQFKKVGEAILPEDAEKSAKMIQRLLVDELSQYDYQIGENGDYIISYKDGANKGKRVEDGHGHAIGLVDLVTEISKSNFDFKVAQSRQAPANGGGGGNRGQGGEGNKKYIGKAPANAAEYMGLLTSADLSTEEKLSVKEQYSQQFSN